MEVPPSAHHPGVVGWGKNSYPPCGLPEPSRATIICDACERGFPESCVHVLGLLMRQPPSPPLPSCPGVRVRQPPVAVTQDWMGRRGPILLKIIPQVVLPVMKMCQNLRSQPLILILLPVRKQHLVETEYWELSTQERIHMLKFICDEMLNTVLIREHIEKCPDKFNDLQKKFYALNYELKDLKDKEEMRTSYGEMNTLSDQISELQESIGSRVESELNMASPRRDFLGKDSLGRLYWVLGRSGKRPLLVADGSTSDCKGWNSASVVVYESDEEIRSLVDWLREYDPREKELKRGIQQWQWQRQRHLHHHLGNFVLSDPPVSSKGSSTSSEQQLMELPSTKPAAILGKTCHCNCLEPIWPAQHHCTSCHETYFTSTEYEDHAGKCSTLESTKPMKSCPYDFEVICRNFATNDSNKETVKEIGLIGSNGVPSFAPSRAAFIDPPVILNKNKRQDDIPNDDLVSSSLEECQSMSSAQKLGQDSAQNCPAGSTSCDENVSKSKKPAPDTTSCEEAASSATDKPTRFLAVNGGLVPESSLRPVIGRNNHVLKQQKKQSICSVA